MDKYFILTLITTIICIVTANTQWSRQIFLATNILMFIFSVISWVFYDHLSVDLQSSVSYDLIIPTTDIHWIMTFGISGISVFFLILSSFLILLCNLIGYDREYKSLEFNFLLTALQISLTGFFTTNDLVIFFLLFEFSLIPIFLIILIWGSSVRRVVASYYFFIYTAIGAVFLIAGISLVIMECGTTDMALIELHHFSSNKQVILFFLFFWGFAVKIPMFPFHLWLPEAHVEAPTEGSVLLAGILLKLGGYGFIKILLNFFPVGGVYFFPLIVTMCFCGIITSSLNAIVQSDFKKLIAYTSISHMNFVVLGIFSYNIYGLAGGVLLMYAHGLIASGLFAAVGIIYDRYASRNIEYFGGLVYGMPIFSTIFFFLTIGNFGFPLTLNFIGELLIIVGLAHTNFFILFLISSGLFLSVIYSILLYNKLIFGNLKPFILMLKDVSLLEFIYLLAPAILAIFLGIFPNEILDCIYLPLLFLLTKST